MKMIKLLAFVTLVAVSFIGQAQFDSTTFKLAKNYYEADNYIKALELFNELLEIDQSSSEAYRMRGNCYFYIDKVDNAISDYRKALIVGSESTSIYYNLGAAFEEKELLDSAAHYFLTSIQLDTTDADGYLRLANVHRQQGKYDSLMTLLNRSYLLDSTNLATIYYLAQEHLIVRDFNKTISFSKKAKRIEPLDISFYLFHGIASFGLSDYESAIGQADSALLIDPLNIDAISMSLESKMLSKSDLSNLVFLDNNEYAFKELNSNTIKERITSISDSEYEVLFNKMKTGEVLSLDDYINFYLLQSTQNNYSPYSDSRNEKISDLYSSGKMEELANISSEVFNVNPLLLDDILMVAEANYSIKNTEEFKKLYAVYFGILEGILATGDGKSFDSAYIVMSTKDEYSLLSYLELRSLGQSLHHENGHSFDLLSTQNPNGEKSDVYFNIDRPWKKLSESLGGKAEKKKKRKKKN